MLLRSLYLGVVRDAIVSPIDRFFVTHLPCDPMSSSMDQDARSGNNATMTPQTLNILRFMLLGASVLFGGVAWFLTRSGEGFAAGNEDIASLLRYVFYGVLIIVLVVGWLMKLRADRAETFEQRAGVLIVGYALAEGLTMFGGVYLLLTGSAVLFLGGLLVFMLAFQMFPIQSNDNG
jgi:hypothetical protein